MFSSAGAAQRGRFVQRLGRFLALGLYLLAGHAAAEIVALVDAVSVTAGGTAPYAHSCALDASGAAYCWGSNDFGQLGDGSRSRRTLATPVAAQSEPFVSISAGTAHTCALGRSGQVWCWGQNHRNPSQGSSSTPVAVPLPGLARGLSTKGNSHGCVVLDDGAVACWGANQEGQLGGGDRETIFVPRVDLPGPVSQVAAGGLHSCALTSTGRVFCWGRNNAGQIGPLGSTSFQPLPVEVTGLPGAVSSIALGDFASCAVLASGAVYCWGSYTTMVFASATPQVVSGMAGGVTKVSVGGFGHLCASLATGGLKCLGLNLSGQLGRGTVTLFEDAGPVTGIPSTVRSFDAGYFHVCAVVANEVRCWGQDTYGELGRNDDALATAPGPVLGLQRPQVQIEGGGDHTCSIDDAGRASCWGSNSSGQLGDGTRVTRAEARTIDAAGSIRFAGLALGSSHSCGFDTTGRVRCWGSNHSGELGLGTFEDALQPALIDGLTGVSSIAAGLFHTCAVGAGGTAHCWGANATGELGDGSTETRATPTAVQGLPGPVTAVAAAFGHSCALTASGGVWCWGSNFVGQLGRSTTSTSDPAPGQVDGLASGVEQIAVGYALSCALLAADRSVRCWGVGYGSTPQVVTGLGSGVVKIAADGGNRISGAQQQLCALMQDQSVRCVGSNRFGQLGDGTTIARNEAAIVGGIRAASAIGAGEHHSCSVDTAGAATCWGGNAVGSLGQGTFGVSPIPVAVVTDKSQIQIEPASADANAASRDPVTDALGRYLVYESAASNLVPADTNGRRDVFRSDRASGGIELVSRDDAGQPIGGDSIEPAVSADGELIVFVAPDAAVGKLAEESGAAATLRRKSTHHAIFLRNMLTGTTRRIATALPGGAGTRPAIAPFGGAIAYTGLPTTPADGTPGQRNVFVVPLNRAGDEYLPGLPNCASCKALAQFSDGPSQDPVLSAQADWMAFTTLARNLPGVGAPCAPAASQIALRNMLTGQLINASAPAAPGQCGTFGARKPSIDWSGTVVVFEADSALASDDRNGLSDIYLFDAGTSARQRISEDPRTGHDGLDASSEPRISGDGNVVTFQSTAKNLDSSEPDNNETNDIFVRNLATEEMRRISRSRRGDQGNSASDGAAPSWDGGSVVFASQASNLALHPTTGVSTDNNNVQDVFRTANPLVVQSKSGTWWVPAESGWGLFTIDQGSALGVGWFTYDSDGEPTWFVGAAFEQPDGSYRGEMFRQTGVPLAAISGLATETSEKFADVTLRFRGTGALQFDYAVVGGPSQGKYMSRFIFNGEDIVCRDGPFSSRAAADNLTDLWWGGIETSGWGVFLNQASNVLVAIWYTYDTDHEALFLTAIMTRQPDGRFAGEIYRQADGTPFASINGVAPSVATSIVGTLTVSALDGETADFDYTIGGVSQRKRISRYVFGSEPGVCATSRP